MPHSPVGICKRECKEIFPQFFIFTVKRDIRFFRPFTEGIWRRDMYVGVGSWAKSSAATESMSEQCTGWHHPINHLSTLQRGCSPAFWLLTFRKTLEEEGTTKVLFLDLLGADAQTSVPPCSWLPSFLSSSALYICGRSWSFFRTNFVIMCCSARTPSFYIPQPLHLLFLHLLCSLPSFSRAQLTPLTYRETPTAKPTAMEDTPWYESGTSPELKYLIISS